MAEAIDSVNSQSSPVIKIPLERLMEVANVPQKAQGEEAKNTSALDAAIRAQSDTLNITREASLLAESGLDKSQSIVRRTRESVDFNLKFDSDTFSNITIKGSFNVPERNLNLNLSFNFQEAIEVDEVSEDRTFNARVKVDVGNVGPEVFTQIEGSGSKLESIVDNMLSRLKELAFSRQYPPISVVLNIASIADLISDTGGVFQRVSRAMLFLNNTLARAVDGGVQEGATLEELVPGSSASSGKSVEIKDFSFQLNDASPQTANRGKPPAATTVGGNGSTSTASSSSSTGTRTAVGG